jgi:DNA-binding CsgD family transcriptional regulator
LESISKLIKGRSTPGILILDLNCRLLFFNEQASDFINDFKKCYKRGITDKIPIPDLIKKLCNDLKNEIAKKKSLWKSIFKSKTINNKFGLPISIRAFFIGGQRIKGPSHILILLEKIVKKHGFNLEKAKKDYKLSGREIEVLKLICEGNSNKEISKKLFISEYTTKDHIKHILHKMGVSSRNQIITSL